MDERMDMIENKIDNINEQLKVVVKSMVKPKEVKENKIEYIKEVSFEEIPCGKPMDVSLFSENYLKCFDINPTKGNMNKPILINSYPLNDPYLKENLHNKIQNKTEDKEIQTESDKNNTDYLITEVVICVIFDLTVLQDSRKSDDIIQEQLTNIEDTCDTSEKGILDFRICYVYFLCIEIEELTKSSIDDKIDSLVNEKQQDCVISESMVSSDSHQACEKEEMPDNSTSELEQVLL